MIFIFLIIAIMADAYNRFQGCSELGVLIPVAGCIAICFCYWVDSR